MSVVYSAQCVKIKHMKSCKHVTNLYCFSISCTDGHLLAAHFIYKFILHYLTYPCPISSHLSFFPPLSLLASVFITILSLSLPLSLFLYAVAETFICSLGDWMCHRGICLSASHTVAEPHGFDKPHLIGRKPGGFERTHMSTKLLLSGII